MNLRVQEVPIFFGRGRAKVHRGETQTAVLRAFVQTSAHARSPPSLHDLNSLRQKSFNFAFDVGSGIQSVTVKKLRLSSKIKKGDRIMLEADVSDNRDAVYDLLDKIGKALPLHLYNVTQVELTAPVIVDADKPSGGEENDSEDASQ